MSATTNPDRRCDVDGCEQPGTHEYIPNRRLWVCWEHGARPDL